MMLPILLIELCAPTCSHRILFWKEMHNIQLSVAWEAGSVWEILFAFAGCNLIKSSSFLDSQLDFYKIGLHYISWNILILIQS